MTDKQNNPDPIAHAARLLREAAEELRQAHAFPGIEGWENETEAKAAYDEHMAAAQALEDWEAAVGAGRVQALSAAPAGFVPLAAFDRLHAHAESLAARLLAAEQAAPKATPGEPDPADIIAGALQISRGHAIEMMLEALEATPQQSAPKAAQYEMDKEASNVRLDIDSNSAEPEQQRDVACSLEVGQHVGNGEHQGASCRGSEDSELLKIAARNLKYFIEHAQFSSFADKRAALNCLDALAAPQQEAQEPGEIPESIERMATGRYKVVPSHESMFHRWAVVATGTQQLYLGREAECQNMARKFAGAFLDGAFVAMQQAAPQPAPSPLSDDVVKDAARYRWLRATTNFATNSQGERIDVRNQPEKWDAAIDAALAAQGGK